MLKKKSNEELFSLYKAELTLKIRNEKNLDTYHQVLNKFQQFLDGEPPSSMLAKNFLTRWSKRKPRTLHKNLSIIKGFLDWYGEEIDLKVKIPHQLPEYVEEKNIQKLIEAIKKKRTHKGSIKRDLLLVELAYGSGLRREELANLRVSDILFSEKSLIVRKGKGMKDRAVPLPARVMQLLQEYTEGMDPDSKIFNITPVAISDKIRRFARIAGVNIHTHSLRHAYATRLLERGANIKAVQELLGHSSIGTTEAYLSLHPKHLRETVDLLDKLPDKPESETAVNLQEPGETTTVPVQVRLEHWRRLVILAEELETCLQFPDPGFGKAYKSKTGGKFHSSWYMNESRVSFSADRDELLFGCLMSHLDSEFPGFSDMLEEFEEDSVKLISGEDASEARDDETAINLRNKLHLVIERGTFKGHCEICRDWDQAKPG